VTTAVSRASLGDLPNPHSSSTGVRATLRAANNRREVVLVREVIALVLLIRPVLGLALLLTTGPGSTPAAQEVSLPGQSGSVKFAVIGDTGTGDTPEYQVAEQMAAARGKFPFELVIMLGDNMYGAQRPQDFVDKFEKPYAPLLQAGVKFVAALGNHDNPSNRNYKGFNMDGHRYFTYQSGNARFFVLDSNALDQPQVAWLENTLRESADEWKIVYFHHPLYSNGRRHGSSVELRVTLEPLFVRYGVNVVFSGHDHTYERIKPQKGITYFVEGASGELASGDVRRGAETSAAAFDRDRSFMLVEISNDQLRFETLSRSGQRVDEGVISRRPPS
jgi:3',5'-cyclic AMP phosphodiesterase CpdA